ncbi:helix-turn-helix domain-containing protein [Gemmatimonadota bacterium Y43]|uniref:helix-turn-helix domain-containing protein n=1 Tax=Gaopeijia maritima TaxID=3119007 RepID=UPI0032955FE0
MDSVEMDLHLTTTQVAELLDVHPSTVKRWCNDGDLEIDKTGGGHRRIALHEVLLLAELREIPTLLDGFAPYQDRVWTAIQEAVGEQRFDGVRELAMEWLKTGELWRISRLLLVLGRHPAVEFAAFCDDVVRGFMQSVGAHWSTGELRVGEEHLASESLAEVLIRLREPFATAPDASRPLAVVGSMEGVRHGLGSWCVRLLLERHGWEVCFLGTDVPMEDFAAIQQSREASLVCISFASPAGAADMVRAMRILARFYEADRPFALALGGDLAEAPEFDPADLPFHDIGIFGSLRDFRDAIAPEGSMRLPDTMGAVR